MDKRTAKNLVKVIVILGYILFAFVILGGILITISTGSVGAIIAGLFPEMGAVGAIIAGFGVALGLVIIALGVLLMVVNNSLGNYENWARWTVVIFSGFFFLSAIGGLPFSAAPLLLHGFIIYFFGFDKTVKKLYEEKKK